MSNTAEIERIGAEAAAEETAQAGQSIPGGGGVMAPGQVADMDHAVAAEFAEFLDMAAKVAGKLLPSIPQRFNAAANMDIAEAAVKLCKKYNYDPKKMLIGDDSPLGAWLGLGIAIGLPGYACYQDYKVIKAKEVKGAEGGDGQQSGE